jgi:hypothetical protein
LISEGYWEGLNFDPPQEAQNANLLIGDIMITKLINFGIVGNVGHMDGNNIRVVNLSPSHQKPHKELTNRIDQYLTTKPTIHVSLMHALKNQTMNCMADNTHNTTLITPFAKHSQMTKMHVHVGPSPSIVIMPMSPVLTLHLLTHI